MRFFKKKKQEVIKELEGFKLGEIVVHKLDTSHRVVLIHFYISSLGEPCADGVYGADPGYETTYHLHELEHLSVESAEKSSADLPR